MKPPTPEEMETLTALIQDDAMPLMQRMIERLVDGGQSEARATFLTYLGLHAAIDACKVTMQRLAAGHAPALQPATNDPPCPNSPSSSSSPPSS